MGIKRPAPNCLVKQQPDFSFVRSRSKLQNPHLDCGLVLVSLFCFWQPKQGPLDFELWSLESVQSLGCIRYHKAHWLVLANIGLYYHGYGLHFFPLICVFFAWQWVDFLISIETNVPAFVSGGCSNMVPPWITARFNWAGSFWCRTRSPTVPTDVACGLATCRGGMGLVSSMRIGSFTVIVDSETKNHS